MASLNRFLLYRSGCKICLEYLKFIDLFNMRLPLDKRVKIIDAFEWENFQVVPNKVMEKFDPKSFNAYPYMYLDGIEFLGGTNAEQLRIMLESYFKGELLV